MSAIPYRPDIQGLRAVAVLAVVLFHANPAWLQGGFVGVDVFLVISGFLIVGILLRRKEQPGYRLAGTLGYFYGSRFKRIAPAYFAMLAVVSLLAAVLLLPQDLATYTNSLRQAAWFNSNSYYAGFGDYFAPASHEQPLLHTWSLAVEIQFYLLVPLLVLSVPARALKWLLGALLVGLTALAEYRLRVLGIQQAIYYSLYARLPEFFAGGLVAACTYGHGGGRRPWLGTLGLVLVLAAAAAQPRLGHFPGLPALWPAAGAALVLLQPAQGVARLLLANRPMVWVGELSYSLYLWHWPVLALLRYYTGVEVLDVSFSLLFAVLTLLLAALSYYWIESPLRAHRTRTRQALGYGVLALAMLGASQSMAKVNQALSPAPLPIEYQRYADPATICHGQIVDDCLKGDLNSDKEVLVLGDSHAAMLNLFFDQLGKELGFKARIITASSCVTIPGFDYQRIAEWAHEACLKQIEQAQQALNKSPIVFIAASWNWQLESTAFQQALEHFLQQQDKVGKKIYLMPQEPLLARNPLRALRFAQLGLPTNIVVNPQYQQANRWLAQCVQRHANALLLDFGNTKVFAQAPFGAGQLLYFDEHHLNEVGARAYAQTARATFAKVLR
ncbi:acyltransferase family protein [Comamonas flocculans]|uniref:Acyltransferase n=1 Tax=Comamonas flocculans TaxID=2597701 RepID=A0A5B8RX50_9BURK|nr:acyltransferase family protein [Comamonas flocculans]QEA13258.1 acyltransferase [Comamonas flocculans]